MPSKILEEERIFNCFLIEDWRFSQVLIILNSILLFLWVRQQQLSFQIINHLQNSKVRFKMGQTCNGYQSQNQPQSAKINPNTFSTGVPIQQSVVKLDLSASRLLQSRTSNIKRRNDSLNQTIKMRLSQLPDISRFKKGNFEDDKKIYMSEIKATYFGEVQQDKPYGYGALQFDNGDYLEGQFTNGRCSGQGRYIKSNGSYYEGDLKNNVADGYGKYFDKGGFRYEGQWKNNLPNGRGEAIYPDQSRYNGQFLNSKRHGNGILMQNKCIFEGEFKQNKLDGTATMLNQNGQKYTGKWKQNLKHGKGQYSWPNGNRYQGEYKSGKREGFGIMYYCNGQKYQGSWINSTKQGEGTYTTLKSTIKGIWHKGELLQERN